MASAPLAKLRAKNVYKAFERAKQDVPDAIILRNGVDPHIDLSFFYVTGIPSGIFEGGMCMVRPNGSVDVVSSILEEESARSAGTGFKLHIPRKREDEEKLLRKNFDGR